MSEITGPIIPITIISIIVIILYLVMNGKKIWSNYMRMVGELGINYTKLDKKREMKLKKKRERERRRSIL